jgi:hypothetical protein
VVNLIHQIMVKFTGLTTDGTDQQIEFETENNGSPFRVWHIAWGVKKELKKME